MSNMCSMSMRSFVNDYDGLFKETVSLCGGFSKQSSIVPATGEKLCPEGSEMYPGCR